MPNRPIYVYAASALAILLIAAGAWAWQTEPLAPGALLAFLQRHARDPAAPLAVVLVYIVGGFALVPVMALIAVTGLAFGMVNGTIYALLGAIASGACSYAVGRYFSAPLVRRYAGPRVEAIRTQLQARGLLAVILVRVVPSGPYTLVNIVAGASGIRARDFLLGTLIGMTPGVVATVGLVHGMRAMWLMPNPYTMAALLVGVAAAVALGYAARQALARWRNRAHPTVRR